MLSQLLVKWQLQELRLQPTYVIHQPGLIIVVIIGHRAEAACLLLVGDAAFGQVLYRLGAPGRSRETEAGTLVVSRFSHSGPP